MNIGVVVIGTLGGVAGMVGALVAAGWVRAQVVTSALGTIMAGLGNAQAPPPDTRALQARMAENDQLAAIAFASAVLAVIGTDSTSTPSA